MLQDFYLHNAGKILHLELLPDLNHKIQGIIFLIEKCLLGFHLLSCWKLEHRGNLGRSVLS